MDYESLISRKWGRVGEGWGGSGKEGFVTNAIPNTDFRTRVRQGLQLVSGNDLTKYLALLITTLYVVRKYGIVILQEELQANGETCHVDGERSIGFPSGIEANYFIGSVIAYRFLHH